MFKGTVTQIRDNRLALGAALTSVILIQPYFSPYRAKALIRNVVFLGKVSTRHTLSPHCCNFRSALEALIPAHLVGRRGWVLRAVPCVRVGARAEHQARRPARLSHLRLPSAPEALLPVLPEPFFHSLT